MSRPYFQFELDAGKKASTVADGLNIHRRQVMGGLALMWMHLYETKTDEVTAFMLQSFFGLEASVCAPALVAMGFLAPAGDAWRARGVKRYTRLTETRQEAGRKGGQATATKRRQPRGQGGKFVATNGDPPQQVPRQTPQQPQQVLRSPKVVDRPVSALPTADTVTVSTVASATVSTVATAAFAAEVPRSSTVATAAKSGPISEIRDSLSFRERENLREGAPAQRESHAPPPEGAGRDSRTGTSEGTRGETPAVPESPAPAPASPSPKDPVPADRWRLWLPEQMPSPTPPPESQWSQAMAWRLMRLTRFAENARPRDYAHLAEQQRVTEELYRDVCNELAPRVTEYQGLALLYHLDDRLSDEETDTSTKLLRWLRTETRPQEVMSDAVH